VSNNIETQLELREGSLDKRVGELKANKNVQAELANNLQIRQRRAGESMENFYKELERVQSENESQLELMSSEMIAIKAKSRVYTAVGSTPTTLPPPDSNARGSSTKSA
jgi:hypothetical protein